MYTLNSKFGSGLKILSALALIDRCALATKILKMEMSWASSES